MHKAKDTRRSLRGIVLITTLAIMTFMVMLGVMLLTTSHNSLRRASGYYQSVVAQQAAVAGAVFAQSCLESDLNWMATRRAGVIVGPMRVGNVEVTQDFDKQIVHGMVFPASQGVACVGEFRISFRTGSLFPNDSTPGLYVSCNNMGSDGTGYTYSGTSVFRAVPKRTVTVVVEGLARAVADGSTLNTNGAVLARRVVETGFYRDMTGFISVAASGGNMVADVEPTSGTWTVEMAQGLSGNPGIRSMHDVQLYANDSSQFACTAGSVHLVSGQGSAYSIGGNGGRGQGLSPTDSSQSANENAAQFARISFDQVKSQNVQNRISAGTYVYWDSKDSAPTYYPDLAYLPHKDNLSYAFNAKDQTISVVDSTSGVTTSYSPRGTPSVPAGFWGSNLSVNVNAPLDVQAAAAKDANNQDVTNRNLAIVAAPSVQDRRVSFNFQQSSGAVLQNSNDQGSVVLRGDISGSGSVLARGDIAFEGHSALTSNANAVVTMYSGGDTVLAPILNVPASVDTKTRAVASTSVVVGATVLPNSAPNPATAALAFDATATSDPAYNAKVGIMATAGLVAAGPQPSQQGDDDGDGPARVLSSTFTLSNGPNTLTFSGPVSGVSIQNQGVPGMTINPSTFTSPDGLTDRVYQAAVNGAGSGLSLSSLQDTAYAWYGSRDEAAVRNVISGVLQYNLGNWDGSTYTVRPSNLFGSPPSGALIDSALLPQVNSPTPSASPSPGATAVPESRVITDRLGRQKTITVNDQEFYGMIYSCGNFTTQLPHTADVSLRGAIVAFGGDPGNSASVPGANGSGRMLFQGKNVTFTYDPTYLGGLYNLFPAGRLSRSFFACY